MGSGIRVSGLVSGLDTEALVEAMVATQVAKKEKLQKAQTKLQWKQDAYKSINTKVYGLYSNTTLRDRYYIVDKIDTDYKQAQQAVTLIEKFGYKDYEFNKGFTYNLDFNLEG